MALRSADRPGTGSLRCDAADLPALEEACASVDEARGAGQVRLLGGHDLFTAAKDRHLITTDTARHKELWPVLGRPGAVAIGGVVVGAWRPKSARAGFTLRLRTWDDVGAPTMAEITERAELMAHVRGQPFAGVALE